jgi:KaiC/GvpD/RAD55 family RecA-like ATPase
MGTSIRLIPSGFSFIDENWGGIYRGGSYLLVGPRKSGRTLLGLQFALESAKSSEVCLFFTNMRPKDLMIQSASLNFDIQTYMNQNLIIVVRVAPPNDIYEMYNPDDYLIEYLNDIITVVNQYNPSRIIFDELTPYVGFRNLDLLKEAFLGTLETIEEKNITSLFVVGEPATQKTNSIIEILASYVTGVIYLQKTAGKFEARYDGGQVTITPNVGHTEGQFSARYKIEPFKGVTVESTVPEPRTKPAVSKKENKEANSQTVQDFPNQPAQHSYSIPSEPYSFTNIYNYADFILLLNNQIALYKSTGQAFNLISFKLDPASQIKGLLSINQLQNAVRQSTNKKDKICVIDNKILVLLIKGNLKGAIELMNGVQNNLPSQDSNYIQTVLEYVSIFNVEVDERIDSAENMMDVVMSAEDSQFQSYMPISKYIG